MVDIGVYAEMADGALTSSKVLVNGMKNVVVLSDELLVVDVSAALLEVVAVDWSTGAISVTDCAWSGDAAGVKNCGLKECGSDAGSVTDVMSTDEAAGTVI